MQTKILQKCVEELNQKEPNISYLKGMLETLIEMSGGYPIIQSTIPREVHNPKVSEEVDEVLSKYEKGTTGKLS